MRQEDLPMYARIAKDLREGIGNGKFALGTRVPSEEELSRSYGVSRMTVRQALTRLANVGLLVRRQGVGTFVAQTKVSRVAGRLLGFHEDALAQGLDPSTKVLARRLEPAGAVDAVALACAPGATVLRVDRLRYHGFDPIGLNTVVIAPSLVDALGDLDFASSFYLGAQRELGVSVREADATIEAVGADADEAARLAVEPGAHFCEPPASPT